MNNQAAQTMPELPGPFDVIEQVDKYNFVHNVEVYTADQMHQYARDYAAALSQTAGVADGWKLVPVEPTQPMRDAGNKAIRMCETEPGMGVADRAFYAYTAMVGVLPGRMIEGEPSNDREALLYLMQQFNSEVWNCERCGHAEETSTMDSAHFLREYLAAAAPAAIATSKTHDRCTDPENCKRCSEDASTPHAGIPHAAPAASGGESAASVSERDDDDPMVEMVARAIAVNGVGREWDDFRPINAFDLDQSDMREYAKAAIAALEQALTQQRGGV